MKIKYIEGDLFAGIKLETEQVLLPHCCNVHGGWGSGFVIPLGKHFPASKEAYLNWHSVGIPNDNFVFDKLRLGQTQFVEIPDSKVIVANMVAQTLGTVRPVYYNKLAKCMDQVCEYASLHNIKKIIAPAFSSGLAGGDWRFIQELIKDCWLSQNIEVIIYYLEQTKPEGLNPDEFS